MEAPKTFLPKGGGYENLTVYKKATIIYDLTFYFTNRFLTKGDRTIDQMVQAARSGKQNIAEGSAASSTSSETELKLMNVARASMQELLVDYEDYLRVRNLLLWPLQDERAVRTREFCKTHTEVVHYMTDIERRSDEALANIAITLIHQFDNMMGKLLDRLQTDFVEKGGIREQMTAARLGYRNEQKDHIAKLEAENHHLKARIAELEQKLKGPMRLIGLISLMGLMGLMGCSKEEAAESPVKPVETIISFSGSLQEEQEVVAGTRAETPLKDIFTTFKVWAFKNTEVELNGSNQPVEPTNYTSPQCVIPFYTVNWSENSAYTTTSNSSGWEYVDGADQTIKYWDWDAKAYKFFGYAAPANTNLTVEFYKPNGASGAYETYGANVTNVAYENYSKCRLSFAADASTAGTQAATPYVSQLWFSNGNPTDYPDKLFGKPVMLKFYKPFAQVRFMFTFAEHLEGLTREHILAKTFAPTDQKAGIAIKGDVQFSYPLTGPDVKESWSVSNPENMQDGQGHNIYFTQDWYTLTSEQLASEDPDNEELIANREKWYTVLPAKNQGTYTLTANINGDEQTAVVPAEYMQWNPGYSYTYIFKVMKGGGIKFDVVQVAIKYWESMQSSEYKVYNW